MWKHLTCSAGIFILTQTQQRPQLCAGPPSRTAPEPDLSKHNSAN